MLESKINEKGYFFQAGQCAVLSLFRIEKRYFVGKDYDFAGLDS